MYFQKLIVLMSLFSPALQDELSQSVSDILKVLLTGPFRKQKVTLVFEEDVEVLIDFDRLLKRVSEPVFLLRLPQESPSDIAGDETENNHRFYLSPSSAVVAVVKSPSWWALWSPPDQWSPQSMLLVSVTTSSCGARDFFQTPLLHKTGAAALLCPLNQRTSLENSTYTVWTWHPFATSKQLIKLGNWNPEAFQSLDQIFADRFQDFHGTYVEIASNVDDRPLFFQREDGQYDGTNLKILQALSQWLNFNFSFITDPLWGERDENGTWTGLLGYLHRGEKDLAINYLTLTPDRVEDFDISVTYHSEGFGLMLKVPPPLPRWLNLVYPYTWQLWASVGGVFILMGSAFHILNHNVQKSLFMNFLAVLQCLIMQSLSTVPKQWSVRTFLGVWFFAAWILTISYTCNLIAVLTVPVYSTRIETQQELADSNLRMCMVDYGEFVPEALAVSSDETLAALGDKMDLVPIIEPLPYMGEEGCIEKVLAGTHAHTETYAYMEIMYSNLGHGKQVYSLKKQLYEGNLAFLFRRGTPWKYKINVGMQGIVEAGLMQKWYRDLMAEFEKGYKRDILSDLQPLSIAHLQGPFLLLLFGFLASLLILVGEYCLYISKESPLDAASHSTFSSEGKSK